MCIYLSSAGRGVTVRVCKFQEATLAVRGCALHLRTRCESLEKISWIQTEIKVCGSECGTARSLAGSQQGEGGGESGADSKPEVAKWTETAAPLVFVRRCSWLFSGRTDWWPLFTPAQASLMLWASLCRGQVVMVYSKRTTKSSPENLKKGFRRIQVGGFADICCAQHAGRMLTNSGPQLALTDHSSQEGYTDRSDKSEFIRWRTQQSTPYQYTQQICIHILCTRSTKQVAFPSTKRLDSLCVYPVAHECHNEDNWVVRFNCTQRFPFNAFPL